MSKRTYQWRIRYKRVRRAVEYGLTVEGTSRWFVTVTQGYCVDIALRANVWHSFLTSLQQHHPGAAACTFIEWSKKRGIHLHAIVIGVPDFSPSWAEHAIARALPGATCHCEEVVSPGTLAQYVTKQLADPAVLASWPRWFRPYSMSRNWPGRPESKRKRRSGQEQERA